MRASIFEIDGVIANGFFRDYFKEKIGSDNIYFNTDVLYNIPINLNISKIIKDKFKNEDCKIIIITDRDIKFDIVTNHWLSKYFPFSIETHFRPCDISKEEFPLFRTGMISSLIDIYKLKEIEIYIGDVRELALVNKQIRNISKKIYLTNNDSITLLEE
jgi:hypothetical protein